MKQSWYYFILFLFLCFILSCSSHEEKTQDFTYTGTGDNVETNPVKAIGWSGERLANAYCGGCHLKPNPDLLTRKLWREYVLPDMGRRLGLFYEPRDPFNENPEIAEIIYPKEPVIHRDDWEKIAEYYIENSPEQMLPQSEKSVENVGINEFVPKGIKVDKEIPPTSSFIKIDETEQSIFVALAHRAIYKLKHMEVVEIMQVGSAPSSLAQTAENELLALGMGIMAPSEEKSGELHYFSSASDNSEILLKGLHRPVDVKLADLNQNGREDLLICNFGHHSGDLAWFENEPDGTYTKHILRSKPGAIQAWITDFNNNGLPDILSLFAQGDEGIFAYINQGDGIFKEEVLLRFPPVYGSSYFELADISGNGHKDIIYVNGDNADLTPVQKNYHGIRIYLNDGKNNFHESFFYPMYGAQKAMVADFNGNGKPDIAAISFFPDYTQAEPESFVLLINESIDTHELKFKAKTFPEQNDGHWLTMDVGDLTGNGLQDIVLGSFIIGPNDAPYDILTNWQDLGYHFMLLENQGFEVKFFDP